MAAPDSAAMAGAKGRTIHVAPLPTSARCAPLLRMRRAVVGSCLATLIVFVAAVLLAAAAHSSANRAAVISDMQHHSYDGVIAAELLIGERLRSIPSMAHAFMERRNHTMLVSDATLETIVRNFKGEGSPLFLDCRCFAVAVYVTDAERDAFERAANHPITQVKPYDPDLPMNASTVVGDPYPPHALPVYYPIVATFPSTYSWIKYVDERTSMADRERAINATLASLEDSITGRPAAADPFVSPAGLAFPFHQVIPPSDPNVRPNDGFISFVLTASSVWHALSANLHDSTFLEIVDVTNEEPVVVGRSDNFTGPVEVELATWPLSFAGRSWEYRTYTTEDHIAAIASPHSSVIFYAGLPAAVGISVVVALSVLEYQRRSEMKAAALRSEAASAAHASMLRLMNHGPSPARCSVICVCARVCACARPCV